MQLTFAPVAAGSLAIVAKPGSTVLVVTAICVVVISLLLGLAQLFLALNWLHREYAYAVRLAVKFGRFHEGLARYPHGFGAPASSDIRKLYDQLGTVSMVAYRSDSETRECVLRVISGMACDDD